MIRPLEMWYGTGCLRGRVGVRVRVYWVRVRVRLWVRVRVSR